MSSSLAEWIDSEPDGVLMSKDDYARELLWDQMLRRKNAFLNAIQANDVSLLPRVKFRDRKSFHRNSVRELLS
jgi:hypothetical protein